MKLFFIVVFLISAGFKSSLVFAGTDADLSKKEVLTWPRATLPKFGCFLEKQFKFRHPRFNCSTKKYKNKGDVCRNTQAYYEGIQFPETLVSQVHTSIRAIELFWEHGELQRVSVSFKNKMKAEDIQKIFGLPPDGKSVRPNIQSYSIQDCNKDFNCLSLVGFDHTGAGDVGCGS